MDEGQWCGIEQLFRQAAELPLAGQSDFLDRACGDDEELRREVESLLAADIPEDGLIQATVARAAEQLPAESLEDSDLLGKRVGRYSITGLIGRGGMGSVYRAERQDDFQMQVAIKLLKRGTDTDTALSRFRSERQILAGLQHPNIARLLDGGATETGLPFFVMEYAEGTPLLEYAAALSIRQRLKLFHTVCSAVQYAHRKSIVHRDIKPSNILVTTEGIPKLLDFGIAKLLDRGADGGPAVTATGMRLMTPGYASPEQVRGEPVTVATDIYSLGAVLYELLTGQRAHSIETNSPAAIEKEICTREPRRPSAIAKDLDPDLDNIVLMALRKEPERRYESVEQFSEDLDRFLRDLPVLARKESRLYRTRKFVRRNRVRVIEAALVLAAASILAVLVDLHGSNWARAGIGSMAVIQIDNDAHDVSLDLWNRAICELLTTRFAKAEVPVISSERVGELIARRITGGERLPPTQVREVARDTHATLFLTGSLTRRGARVLLDMRVQETATGHVLFRDEVEGSGASAVSSVADEAATRILARLGEKNPHKSNVSSARPANLEAMQAYEEGLRQSAQFRGAETQNALQRAIDLDPQFLMAHYYLADTLRFFGAIPNARRKIARAVQLAHDGDAPRLQKLLTQSLQLRLDFRLEEAADVLEAARREFSLETEPLAQLASIRNAEGRFADAAALLENVVRMDPGDALAHDQLGYAYGLQGDAGRGVASIDRYAALLPPGSMVPFCSRGDVFLINERYDEAIAQYRKTNNLTVMATAAAYAGDYTLGDFLLWRIHAGTAGWYEAAGDLAAARGQLDRASGYYQQEAELYRADALLREWFARLRLVRISLEQRQPEAVLALGQEHTSLWAAGFRGLAYLLLHQDARAELEFAGLRDAIAPMLGSYMAEKVIEFHRMQAASYAGHFDQVVQMWPRLPPSFWNLYALDVGRAYLKCGLYSEAEHHLQLALRGQLAFFWNSDMEAQHSVLTWMLAQFYMGQVFEKTHRQGQANANYEEFLKHFEHSSARLPQITDARSPVPRAPQGENGKLLFGGEFPGTALEHGKLLFNDEFSGTALERGWSVAENVKWELGDGLLKTSVQGEEAAQGNHALPFHDAIFELRFRRDGALNLVLRNESRPVCALFIGPWAINLRLPTHSGGVVGERVAGVHTTAALDAWHTLRMVVQGKRINAHLDGQLILTGERPAFDVDKTGFGLRVERGNASFDYIRVFELRQR